MRKSFNSGTLIIIMRAAASCLLSVPVYLYLADILSPWFVVSALAAAVFAGYMTFRTGLRLVPAVAVIGLSAFIVRAVVFMVVGILSPAIDSAVFDFSLFEFDSGFFPLFLLYVYTAVFEYIVLNRPKITAVEVLSNSGVYALLMWSQGGYSLTIFSHPGTLIVFGILFFIVELSVLLFSTGKSGTGNRLGFLFIVIPVFLFFVFLFFNRYSEGASKDSGGLMKPTLFRFDFSDYVKLETEISMGNDLVMLFRNYGYLNSVYLRRFYLSGYRPERGFFMETGPGEAEQPLTLPDSYMETGAVRYPRRVKSEQEYFIVNFDPSSLVAMNYPVNISPLTNWNGSSFLRNYRVVSESVELPSWELSESPLLEMEADLYKFYTDYGDDQKIRGLAEEITAGIENPYDKVIAILFYLHDSYYYSLKPGVAPDGNQLHYFLFDSKKGYCSYFAFSMALMCRSLGIPARVAAGFFIDPQSGVLNVYPVREDMAHAWVEVGFEDFGWVEFDPTTDRLAPGEDLEFGTIDISEYSGLVEEIFSNEYFTDMSQNGTDEESGPDNFINMARRFGKFLESNSLWFVLVFYTAAVLVFHIVEALLLISSGKKRRVRALYRKAFRLCRAFGVKRERNESVLEHAARAESTGFTGFHKLAECYLESVFSCSFGNDLVARAEQSMNKFVLSYKKQSRCKRLILSCFPFVRFRFIRSVSVPLTLLCFIFLAGVFPAEAREAGGPGDYIEMAAREQDSENYEAALKLLNEGIKIYPDSWELRSATGDLYSDRKLYNLALMQYDAALEIAPDNIDVMYNRSSVEGFLNLDEDSIQTLEKILQIDPGHYDALADLGWMYFKTFRLREAEELLLGAIEIYDDSPILRMTLGTVYSGLYDYENAERYYLESIEMALDKGWDYFASVSYYNLSLLEYGFYNYKKAFEYTNKSIEYGERAPGYISRAEIYLGRMDFENAYLNYQQAYTFDSTPLALMGQADLYLTFGMLDEALAHIKEVLKHEDSSWMYYFGVDPDRHRMEADRLLSEIYRAMSKRERYTPSTGPDRINSLLKRIKYGSLRWYHDRRYRRASYEVGLSNERHGNMLDAAWAYYIANEGYEKQDVKYLRRAQETETAIAPAAEGTYLLEAGRLEKDPSLLNRALNTLDPEWEKLQISRTLVELVRLEKRNSLSRQLLSEQLYLLNPGAFITEGLEFPLAVDFDAGVLMKHLLRRSGFNILLNNHDNGYRYRLSAADNQDRGVLYSVTDSKTGKIIFSISVEAKPNTPSKISVLCTELKTRLFSITDGKDAPF